MNTLKMARWFPGLEEFTMINLNNYSRLRVVCQEDGSGTLQGIREIYDYNEWEGELKVKKRADILLRDTDCSKVKEAASIMYRGLTDW